MSQCKYNDFSWRAHHLKLHTNVIHHSKDYTRRWLNTTRKRLPAAKHKSLAAKSFTSRFRLESCGFCESDKRENDISHTIRMLINHKYRYRQVINTLERWFGIRRLSSGVCPNSAPPRWFRSISTTRFLWIGLFGFSNLLQLKTCVCNIIWFWGPIRARGPPFGVRFQSPECAPN